MADRLLRAARASLATPPPTRSSAPTAGWPASCTPTPTPTPRPRRGSRRWRRPTRCCPTPRSAQRYDRFGADGRRRRAATRSASAAAGSTTSSRRSSAAAAPSAAAGAGPTGPPRGADLELVVDLDFEEAVFGVRHPVDVRARWPARRATAPARQPGTRADHLRRVRRRRPGAAGAPVVPRPDGQHLGLPALRRPRPGHRRPVPGLPRRGPPHRGAHLHRRHPRRRRHRLHPAPHRARRAPGRAAAPNGDLYVHVRVRPHERFARDGVDLHCDLPVTLRPGRPRRPPRARHPRRRRGPRRPARHPDRAGSSACGAGASRTSSAATAAT